MRGPIENAAEPRRDGGRDRVIEVGLERDPLCVGVTADLGCCCRIRRSPETPRPCSRSGNTDDLGM